VTHEQLSEAGDKIDRRVEVALGRQLTIQLSSNPASTNYKWTEAALSNKTVLRQTSHVFVKPPLKNPRIVGAPGYQVWTFRTVQRGKTSIDMRYLPRDDRQDEGTKFHLDVVVK
jgi:predicted secreted protein